LFEQFAKVANFLSNIFLPTLLHSILSSFILWRWKKLSFGINFWSYLIGSFQTVLEQILAHSFLRYWRWYEAFPYLRIKDAGGGSLKAKHLNITVAVWAPLKT